MIMGARVLIVEDDPTMAEVLLAYLRKAGYSSDWAGRFASGTALAANLA